MDAREEQIKQLAREHAELAIETLAEVAEDRDEKGAARVAAAAKLLERGFGAPERKVSQQVDVTLYDARTAHFKALQRLAAKRPAITGPAVEDADFEEVPRKKAE